MYQLEFLSGTGEYAADGDAAQEKLIEDLIGAVSRPVKDEGLIRLGKIRPKIRHEALTSGCLPKQIHQPGNRDDPAK